MSRDRSSQELCVVVRQTGNQFPPAPDQNSDYGPIQSTLQNVVAQFSLRVRTIPDRPGRLLRGSRAPFRLYFYDTSPNEAVEVADRINEAILGGLDNNIVIAFPNRSAKGQPIDSDGGGPGAPPEDIPIAAVTGSGTAANYFGRLMFPNTTLTTAMAEGDGNPDNNAGVMVAILDSWPAMSESDWQKNWLLQSLRAELAARLTPPLGPVESDYDPMPSHGLFVAGLIHSIAPTVPIRVVQALNEKTAGDIGSVLEGLEELYLSELREEPPFLILNLSLRFNDAPPKPPSRLTQDQAIALLLRLLEFVHDVPNPSADESAAADEARDKFADVRVSGGQELYDNIIETLFWSVTRSWRALIVAAAGNDREGRNVPPPDETAPAYYGDDVLSSVLPGFAPVVGVAALSSFDDMLPAAYTNWGDIATLGGDVEKSAAELLAPYDMPTKQMEADAFDNVDFRVQGGKPDAIVGLKADSPSGWCYWAGSSFATAIVSGVAAALASTDAGLRNPVVLRERLLTSAVTTGTIPPYTPTNEAMPVLRVEQNR